MGHGLRVLAVVPAILSELICARVRNTGCLSQVLSKSPVVNFLGPVGLALKEMWKGPWSTENILMRGSSHAAQCSGVSRTEFLCLIVKRLNAEVGRVVRGRLARAVLDVLV